MHNPVTPISDNVDAVSIWSLESLSRFWETYARLFVKLCKEFLDTKWFHGHAALARLFCRSLAPPAPRQGRTARSACCPGIVVDGDIGSINVFRTLLADSNHLPRSVSLHIDDSHAAVCLG